MFSSTRVYATLTAAPHASSHAPPMSTAFCRLLHLFSPRCWSITLMSILLDLTHFAPFFFFSLALSVCVFLTFILALDFSASFFALFLSSMFVDVRLRVPLLGLSTSSGRFLVSIFFNHVSTTTSSCLGETHLTRSERNKT